MASCDRGALTGCWKPSNRHRQERLCHRYRLDFWSVGGTDIPVCPWFLGPRSLTTSACSEYRCQNLRGVRRDNTLVVGILRMVKIRFELRKKLAGERKTGRLCLFRSKALSFPCDPCCVVPWLLPEIIRARERGLSSLVSPFSFLYFCWFRGESSQSAEGFLSQHASTACTNSSGISLSKGPAQRAA
jgi:hypothetical protein